MFLHGQQVYLDRARRLGRPWDAACFLPGEFDKTTSMFRQWLEAHGEDGRVPWAPGCDPALPPYERDSNRLFDVYEQCAPAAPRPRSVAEQTSGTARVDSRTRAAAAAAGATAKNVLRGLSERAAQIERQKSLAGGMMHLHPACC